MPNIPQQQTIVQYITNSSQLQYTFAFYAPLPTDIQVYYQAPNAIPIPSTDILPLNSQYTVTYNSDPTTGGYITLLFTPTTGYYLTINRNVSPTLNTSFSSAQNFNGANLDVALDRLLLLVQQNLNYILERNLSYVINTYLPMAQPYTQLPPLAQNQFWVGSGSGVIAGTVAQVPSASLLQSMLANNSPGTDGARLVGYYDVVNSAATTVQAYLAGLLNSPVITTPIINQPVINQPVIKGIISGVAAASGVVGELISNVITGGNSLFLTNNLFGNVTSITLTPGDWDVWGNVYITDSNGLLSAFYCWINTIPATLPDISQLTEWNAGATHSQLTTMSFNTPVLPFNVTVNTPVYLSLLGSSQTSGGLTCCGGIYARRRR